MAARIPRDMTTTIASSIAIVPRFNEVGNVCLMISLTVRVLYENDVPKSPCIAFQRKVRYCHQSGLSRLYLARRFAIASGLSALRPWTLGSSGLPGVLCATAKTIADITKSVGINQNR